LESGKWTISAKTISSWTGGLARSTIDTAVKQLEARGLFEITRAGARSPREFRLLVECPQGCPRATDHLTPNELKALAIARKAMPDIRTPDQTPMPDLDTPMPDIRTPMPDLQATNKESIKTYKKDEADSFEFLFITETLEHLKATNQFTANHSLLKAALEDDPNSVLDRAKTILSKEGIQNPKSYLKGSITNNPESLIKRPGKDNTAAPEVKQRAHRALIISQYEKAQEDNPESLIQLSPYDSVWAFLFRVCPDKLTLQAAKIASKAEYFGVDISKCRSLTEAGELTCQYEDVPNPAERARRNQEAKKRAFDLVDKTF
jgi:hypothetical protein